MPKIKHECINFEEFDWELDWESVLGSDGNRVWGPSSNPLKNLRKAFKRHYKDAHTIMDIPWCVMTQDQRASKSFMGADDEVSGDSDETYERSDERESSESSYSN